MISLILMGYWYILLYKINSVAGFPSGLVALDCSPLQILFKSHWKFICNHHNIICSQVRDFGFYTAYLVTEKGFDYPKHQRLLYEYHEAFMRVPNVVKNDDGGLPGNFWLAMFRDWLLGEKNLWYPSKNTLVWISSPRSCFVKQFIRVPNGVKNDDRTTGKFLEKYSCILILETYKCFSSAYFKITKIY